MTTLHTPLGTRRYLSFFFPNRNGAYSVSRVVCHWRCDIWWGVGIQIAIRVVYLQLAKTACQARVSPNLMAGPKDRGARVRIHNRSYDGTGIYSTRMPWCYARSHFIFLKPRPEKLKINYPILYPSLWIFRTSNWNMSSDTGFTTSCLSNYLDILT